MIYGFNSIIFNTHSMEEKAINALDRNISTCTKDEGIGPNSQHKSVMWRVDFGRMHNIYSVNFLFKHYKGHSIIQWLFIKEMHQVYPFHLKLKASCMDGAHVIYNFLYFSHTCSNYQIR